MRIQRGKQCDWSRPFRLISSKREFESIENNDNELTMSTNHEDSKKTTHHNQKQQIIVPKIETVRRITQVKPFAKLPLNYIRILNNYNLPKLLSYELTEVDHIFINAHEGRFKLSNENCLTTQFVQRAFIQMQLKAKRDLVIPRRKLWMDQFIQKQYKELTNLTNYQQFSEVVYNFWRNRREQLKFPLLRLYWRPNPDEFNHLLAFKLRQKQKRNLRRTNRVIDDDQISVQLADQFKNMILLCERLTMREQLKLKAIKLQCVSFHNETESNFKAKNFTKNLKKDMANDYTLNKDKDKDKETIKKFQCQLELFKKNRENQQEVEEVEPTNEVCDKKTTIINFLSTLFSFSDQFGINYDTFSHYDQEKIIQSKNVIISPLLKSTQAPIVHQDPLIDDQSLFNIRLSLQNGFVLRKPNCNPDIDFEGHSFQNYLSMKGRKVGLYFFGDDDDGDYRDLRKNISTSFKKFIQLRQATQ